MTNFCFSEYFANFRIGSALALLVLGITVVWYQLKVGAWHENTSHAFEQLNICVKLAKTAWNDINIFSIQHREIYSTIVYGRHDLFCLKGIL